MALRIKCPSCDMVNRVDEEKRGRRIRCRECDRPIRVPLDDDEDEDREEEEEERPRRRKKRKAGSNALLWIIGLSSVGVMLLVCLGVAGYAGVSFFKAADRLGRARDRVENPNRNQPAKGKIILDQRGLLTVNDPRDPTPELAEVGARMKVHQVKMEAGKAYVISLDSDAFDSYLRVESPAGKTVAEDDDGGDALNARLVFRPTEAGVYRVIATAWDGGTGPFHLIVQEAD